MQSYKLENFHLNGHSVPLLHAITILSTETLYTNKFYSVFVNFFRYENSLAAYFAN